MKFQFSFLLDEIQFESSDFNIAKNSTKIIQKQIAKLVNTYHVMTEANNFLRPFYYTQKLKIIQKYLNN